MRAIFKAVKMLDVRRAWKLTRYRVEEDSHESYLRGMWHGWKVTTIGVIAGQVVVAILRSL